MNKPEISIILTTYNQPEWLEKVLWGYEVQTAENFEVVIADDGSKQPTFDVIEKMQKLVHFPIQHVWHEDKGYDKCGIMNLSIQKAQANYLLFSDADCIPRNDFVQVHLSRRKRGHFLSCGYYKLSMELSKKLTNEDITSGRCFDLKWMKQQGLPSTFKNNKFTRNKTKANFLNWITPTKATWNGHGASTYRDYIENANGFDTRMEYGGQDRELGERLVNAGITGIQIRYSTVSLHLDHKRGYKTQESIDKNNALRQTTRQTKIARTPYGIVKDL